MKRLLIVSLYTCLCSAVFSQQNKLQVGDTLPSCILTNVLNYPGKNMTLPLSSGKWIMLDFWNTHCPACVESLPKLEQFQHEFSSQMTWLLVAYQPKEKVEHFFKKRRELTGLKKTPLPIACGDSLLTNYFKPEGFPHCVWIDGFGVIRSVTGSLEITRPNILSILRDRNFQMEQKDDSLVMVEIDSPLYRAGTYADGKELKWSTTLSRYMRYIPWMNGFHITDSSSTIVAFNVSIKRLYQIAFNYDSGYGDEYWMPENRTFFNIWDTAAYVFKIDGKYRYENFYCYHAILPAMSVSALKNTMQNDLKKYFGLNARMEKRKMACWVLSAKDTLTFKSSGGSYAMDWDGANFREVVKNGPFDQFRAGLEHAFLQFSPFPFVNEIHTNENIDLMLENLKMYDPESLKRELRKYGISLNLESRLVDVLVIDEPPKIDN